MDNNNVKNFDITAIISGNAKYNNRNKGKI